METMDLEAILQEMATILTQSNEPRWAANLTGLAEALADTTDQREARQSVAREGLRLFGGMGSLNDLVLYPQGKLDIELNNRFDELRIVLNRKLVDLL